MDIGHDLPVRETHVRSGNDPHSRPSKDISVKFRDSRIRHPSANFG